MRTVTIDGIEYYARSDVYGFGYEIIKKVPLIDNPDRYSYQCFFRHEDHNVVSELFSKMIETNTIPALPNVIESPVVHKVLVHKTKHYSYHYKIDTREELEKVVRYILKEEYDDNNYWNPYEDSDAKNNTGFNTIEEIEALPDGEIKKYALKEFEKCKKYISNHSKDIKIWDELQEVLKGNGKLGNVMRVFEHLEQDRYQIENLITVE